MWIWKAGELTSAHTVNLPASCRDLAMQPGGQRVALALANGTIQFYLTK